jgi:hypothetical protein
MKTKRSHARLPPGDQSFEAAGGAAELASVGLDGLAHAGPWAIVIGLLALAVAPVLWLRRRRAGA